ncbi:MAG: helix-turn-helix domain-containing protein [Chloroflexi bacterium]|nr:helix-turn-helix domain-containing protein [Chloroflexota bacterium]MYF81603.1 helix-turn-helix domain-containing protein [Chloroflexota bacterium]MYI04703.1 helix-turn-helix domain-containing protein [Chloroflexota bacterium]
MRWSNRDCMSSLFSSCEPPLSTSDSTTLESTLPKRPPSHITNSYPSFGFFFGENSALTNCSGDLPVGGTLTSFDSRIVAFLSITPLQLTRWKAIQQAQLQGLSMRATARLLGISRVTVSNYVRANGVPGRRTRAASSLSEQRDQTDRIAAQLD